MGCAEGCSFSENITVPDTKVNFCPFYFVNQLLLIKQVNYYY